MKKNDQEMYNLLLDKQDTAIKNAKKLETTYENKIDYSNANPYTSVYKLVEFLNDQNK